LLGCWPQAGNWSLGLQSRDTLSLLSSCQPENKLSCPALNWPEPGRRVLQRAQTCDVPTCVDPWSLLTSPGVTPRPPPPHAHTADPQLLTLSPSCGRKLH
jgi:hypothetical protein